jgi:hypothetical protein
LCRHFDDDDDDEDAEEDVGISLLVLLGEMITEELRLVGDDGGSNVDSSARVPTPDSSS